MSNQYHFIIHLKLADLSGRSPCRKNDAPQTQTCLTGAFTLSHETRPTSKNLTSAAYSLSTETPKWKPIYGLAPNANKG
ncbi:hypothetical protein [Spirosoma areae]